MAKIVKLRLVEGVRLNPDRIVTLYAELGEPGADRAIRRTMRQMSRALDGLRRDHAAGQALNETVLRAFADNAATIGMASAARVAEDVIVALLAGDGPAREATFARLGRIGDRSFSAVIDLQDMSL
ncbi:MAG: hypothetical protein H6895_04330 [Defluviimonas sp.]|uniref:hypothetical protein n=1 Tax=Albidovulum sp. TaxID=1872424 RepID=UPI001D3E75FF|nr:hypothetical protein [Paracoccaceae bacterium]MCC0063301.1 hypothetical protein [Defluviimonas sp.]